jgi:DNA-binding transcriptional LysR family regulator
MHYDLVDLKIFIAVADEGNVSRGASRCHLAPSSASLRLKGLEEAVGAPLFLRQARGVTLTPAGHAMIEHARRCMAQLEQMHADMLPFAQGLNGHMRVFANNNAISSHLPDDLAKFFAAYPSVHITLQEHLSQDVVAAVAAGRADMGVAAKEAEHPALEFVPYRTDELVLLVPRAGAMAASFSDPVSFSACFEKPFISLQQGAAIHTYLMNAAAHMGGRLDVRVQVSSYNAVIRLVASGAGIGIVPRSVLAPSDEERVAVLSLSDGWAVRHLSICYPKQSGNPFVHKLLQIMNPG